MHAWCRGHGLLGRRRHPPRLLAVHGVDQGPSRRSMSAVATAAALSVCRCRFGSRWPQRGRASVGRGFAALFVGGLPPRGGFTACTRGGHAVSEGACLGCVRHTCTCATAAVMPPHGVRRVWSPPCPRSHDTIDAAATVASRGPGRAKMQSSRAYPNPQPRVSNVCAARRTPRQSCECRPDLSAGAGWFGARLHRVVYTIALNLIARLVRFGWEWPTCRHTPGPRAWACVRAPLKCACAGGFGICCRGAAAGHRPRSRRT